jgi:ASC-1-like (ASCH) protein
MVKPLKTEAERAREAFVKRSRKAVEDWVKDTIREKIDGGKEIVFDLESGDQLRISKAQGFLEKCDFQIIDVFQNEFEFEKAGYNEMDQEEIPLLHHKAFAEGQEISEIILQIPKE